MQRILRFMAPLALLIAALALVACGGSGKKDTGGTPVSADSDVNTILDKTFSGNGKKVDSGKFDLKLKANVSGGGSSLQGPIEIAVSGPFQSEGKAKLPKFDLNLSVTGIPSTPEIKAGVENTGSKAFVNFKGTEYVLSSDVYKQFKQGYEQAAAKSPAASSSSTSLSKLGINPKDWLKDPKVDGGSSVGGTDTVKITGGIDVSKLLDDVNGVLSKAGSLGLSAASPNLPTKLTQSQKDMVTKAIKSADVTIETGKDDSILRRLSFVMGVQDPQGGGGKADIDFDISLTGLNESQSFPEPANAKPFTELMSQLGGLGGLGALGGLGGSSSGGSSASGGASAKKAQAYAQCVKDAGSDRSKLQACASKLAP